MVLSDSDKWGQLGPNWDKHGQMDQTRCIVIHGYT